MSWHSRGSDANVGEPKKGVGEKPVVVETADHQHVLLARGCFISHALDRWTVKLIYRRKSS